MILVYPCITKQGESYHIILVNKHFYLKYVCHLLTIYELFSLKVKIRVKLNNQVVRKAQVKLRNFIELKNTTFGSLPETQFLPKLKDIKGSTMWAN